MRRASMVVLLLLAAASLRAHTVAGWSPDSMVENPRYVSANGRFTFVLWRYPGVPDFGELRADSVFAFTDSGERIVIAGRGEPFGTITILRGDGAVVAALTAADVFTPRDLETLRAHRERFPAGVVLRDDTVVVDCGPGAEIVFDAMTGERQSPVRNALPAPRVWATSPSRRLLAQAVEQPLPEYPRIALLARIRGVVLLDVDVAADGSVSAVRVRKPLPFGAGDAAADAVRRWRFTPRGEPFGGEVDLHFDELTDDELAAVSTDSRAARMTK
jgi:TonB family protein